MKGTSVVVILTLILAPSLDSFSPCPKLIRNPILTNCPNLRGSLLFCFKRSCSWVSHAIESPLVVAEAGHQATRMAVTLEQPNSWMLQALRLRTDRSWSRTRALRRLLESITARLAELFSWDVTCQAKIWSQGGWQLKSHAWVRPRLSLKQTQPKVPSKTLLPTWESCHGLEKQTSFKHYRAPLNLNFASLVA